MAQQPNILFLMTDQMQAAALEADCPCRTPNLDRLLARGVRVSGAYTPNAICSPARASLMTGALPHRHGVLTVTHCAHDYHCDIQPDLPHFAQALRAAGYHTAYFGKWHVERSNDLRKFGWDHDASLTSPAFKQFVGQRHGVGSHLDGAVEEPSYSVDEPEGFAKRVLYGISPLPSSRRQVGLVTEMALTHLQQQAGSGKPWCCLVSVTEPHDPFICGRAAFEQYDAASLPLPKNSNDPMTDKPNLYRRIARVFSGMTDSQKRQATACYYGLISEIDEQYGRLLDFLESSGQADNTIVVLTSDHGELLGAHGLYMKNVGAFEEVYRIPLVVAGPGLPQGQVARARVGLQDLAATLCELTGTPWASAPDSRSAAALLRDPAGQAEQFQRGYAEYFGSRHWFSQRVIWDGPWKLVWNGFDFDELYQLDEDPHELDNRIDDPSCRDVVRRLMAQAYSVIRASDDHPLLGANYPALRSAEFGPGISP